jgi:hypothetical protein
MAKNDYANFTATFDIDVNGYKRQANVTFGPNVSEWAVKYGEAHETRAFNTISEAQKFIDSLGKTKFDLRTSVRVFAPTKPPGADD